mmetsp:Transcript_33425/g.90503  ORF Transcript_33425/g.90503 Transcript_33425/m.90503 type:complete len:206 (+) Transcript_33425:165-782(+)
MAMSVSSTSPISTAVFGFTPRPCSLVGLVRASSISSDGCPTSKNTPSLPEVSQTSLAIKPLPTVRTWRSLKFLSGRKSSGVVPRMPPVSLEHPIKGICRSMSSASSEFFLVAQLRYAVATSIFSVESCRSHPTMTASMSGAFLTRSQTLAYVAGWRYSLMAVPSSLIVATYLVTPMSLSSSRIPVSEQTMKGFFRPAFFTNQAQV